jgi:hypothetical protein
MDPLLIGVGREAGLSDSELLAMLPAELTLWIDPDEVCVRFGEDGSVGVIYGGKATRSDSESEESQMSSTDYSSDPDSDCPSPKTVMPIDLVPIVLSTIQWYFVATGLPDIVDGSGTTRKQLDLLF